MSMLLCVLTCGADYTSNVLFQPKAEVIEKTLLSIPPPDLILCSWHLLHSTKRDEIQRSKWHFLEFYDLFSFNCSCSNFLENMLQERACDKDKFQNILTCYIISRNFLF